MIIIKSINLSAKAETPVIGFSKRDGEQSTDCTFPGKDSQSAPPAAAFEDAVSRLYDALYKAFPELEADARTWAIKSVAYVWDKEYQKWGYKISATGIQESSAKIDATFTESSPDQVDDRVYAALKKLQYEAERYVNGVSAQYNLFATDESGSDIDEGEAA